MCIDNKMSLVVSYLDLHTVSPVLAIMVVDYGVDCLPLFDQALTEYVLQQRPHYLAMLHPNVYFPSTASSPFVEVAQDLQQSNVVRRDYSGLVVRFFELPLVTKIQDLRCLDLNALISVVGIVSRRTALAVRVVVSGYKCLKCRHEFRQNNNPAARFCMYRGPKKPAQCLQCEGRHFKPLEQSVSFLFFFFCFFFHFFFFGFFVSLFF